MTKGRSSTHSRSSTTYLNHDHRESENIRFLAVCPLVQDLWRSPPCTVAMEIRDAQCRIQILGDSSEAKIRQTRMAGVIHKDVWLDGCQCGSEARLEIITYSLEIPVNDIAGVEVTEALSDVG